jgi:lipopolysaccharide transport protein LptA
MMFISKSLFMSVMARLFVIVLCVLPAVSGFAAPLSEHNFQTVSISADLAFEDSETETLHFEGHFQMQSDDWTLDADLAEVSGSPQRPERVFLEGAPARFIIERGAGDGGQGRIEASAPNIEYLRSSNILSLSGGATLRLNNEVIRSGAIEFDLSSDRYQSFGKGGVSIEVPPAD